MPNCCQQIGCTLLQLSPKTLNKPLWYRLHKPTLRECLCGTENCKWLPMRKAMLLLKDCLEGLMPFYKRTVTRNVVFKPCNYFQSDGLVGPEVMYNWALLFCCSVVYLKAAYQSLEPWLKRGQWQATIRGALRVCNCTIYRTNELVAPSHTQQTIVICDQKFMIYLRSRSTRPQIVRITLQYRANHTSGRPHDPSPKNVESAVSKGCQFPNLLFFEQFEQVKQSVHVHQIIIELESLALKSGKIYLSRIPVQLSHLGKILNYSAVMLSLTCIVQHIMHMSP